MTLAYREDLLAALLPLGLRPRADTPPALVREQVNDLYCYELRILRGRLMRRQFEKITYADRVRDLRQRYWMLSVPLAEWTSSASASPPARTDVLAD